MEHIQSFEALRSYLTGLKRKIRIAFVMPTDPQSVKAIQTAVNYGITEAHLIGQQEEMSSLFGIDKNTTENYIIHHQSDPLKASELAVEMARENQVDAIMKGMVNTDVLLKAVLNRDTGIVPYGNVVTFVAAIEIPGYHKLLFVTDPAVIPAPTLRQFQAMIGYSIDLIGKFGIEKPKIALIHATEKKNLKLKSMQEYTDLLLIHENGEFPNAIIDGPLDIFLALDRVMGGVKEVNTPVLGDADLLVFPGIESGNVFYKCMMSFANAQMGGMLFGCDKPVILTSRSDSHESKFNSIALACLFG